MVVVVAEVTAGATVAEEVGSIKTASEEVMEAMIDLASIAKGLQCPATLASWVPKVTPIWEVVPKMEHSTNSVTSKGNQCVSTSTMMTLLSSMVKAKDWTWASNQLPSRANSRCSKPSSRCNSKCSTTSRVAKTGLAHKQVQEVALWVVVTDNLSAMMIFSEGHRSKKLKTEDERSKKDCYGSEIPTVRWWSDDDFIDYFPLESQKVFKQTKY